MARQELQVQAVHQVLLDLQVHQVPQEKMVLQVHDELNFDVLKTELEQVKQIVKTEMEMLLLINQIIWISTF